VQFDEKPKQPVEHTGRDLRLISPRSRTVTKVLLEDSLGFAAGIARLD
jgi:hypothetical protein